MECYGLAITLPDGRTILALGDTEADLIEAILNILDDDLVHDATCCTVTWSRRYTAGAPCDCSMTKRLN